MFVRLPFCFAHVGRPIVLIIELFCPSDILPADSRGPSSCEQTASGHSAGDKLLTCACTLTKKKKVTDSDSEGVLV